MMIAEARKENSTRFIKISRDQTEPASQTDTYFHPPAAIFLQFSPTSRQFYPEEPASATLG